MRNKTFIGLFVAAGCYAACQSPSPSVATDSSPRQFMARYEQFLRQGEFDSVAALYDPRGAVLITQGSKKFLTFNDISAMYKKFPHSASGFAWKDLRIDSLDAASLLVTARFLWHHPNEADTASMLYTGVLVKTHQGWRIRHEHESADTVTLRKIASRIQGQ